MKDEFKPNCLLKTFILQLFANNLVALIISVISILAVQLAKSNSPARNRPCCYLQRKQFYSKYYKQDI